MKFNIFKLNMLLVFLCCLMACQEENLRVPLENDGVAPSPVSDIRVENLPGGAKITYTIPADEDLLYVEASYERAGETVTTNSSSFKNELIVEGLRSSGEKTQTVNLVTVDRSNNRSTPTEVSITPQKAPIDDLFETLQLTPDFGGVRLHYDNPNNIQVEFQLFSKNTGGKFDYLLSAFVEDDQKQHFSFRGLEPEEQTFAVLAVDRWNNITEMVEATLTPIKEEQLDINEFGVISPSLSTDEPDAFGWTIHNLWNGNIGGSGFHTSQARPGSVVPPYTEPHHIVSFDLGVTANLSRLKFWLRNNCCGTPFGHGDPRYFEIWGIDELPDNGGTTLEGWTKLVANGEVIKPSGAPLGQHSAEDKAAAVNGIEFEVSDPNAKIRYIRFVNFQSWSGGKFMHIMEFNFWGRVL